MSKQSLVARDQKHLWHPYTQMQNQPPPMAIVRAKGIYLYTSEGRRILDGTSSWWVNLHGHAHPKLNAALTKQANELEHVLFAGCTHRPAVELAERLIELLPKGLNRVFYSDNGSTAVEVALKLAVQYWQNKGNEERRTFISLDHAYHGDTVGAMSVSEASSFTSPFSSMLFPVLRANDPYCYHCPVGLDRVNCQIDCLSNLEAKLKSNFKTVAGVIVEPMLQGAGGMVSWPAEFLSGVRSLCDRYGTLMIADEVMTGFGRTGRMFACEHAAITPDIICLSKGLTAGYLPMGATATTESVYEAFLSDNRQKAFLHGHSYTANPLACAVGIASLDIFKDENVLQRITKLETQLHDGFESFRGLQSVGDVRVIGGVGIVELKSKLANYQGGGYFDQIGQRLAQAFLDQDILLRPLGNVVYFMPPYAITEQETAQALKTIGGILETTKTT